jgi:tRNA A-37 threonylcarbamoyl transferase component Bud32
MIDFGLAYNSNLVEDKAVDLYVLERALGATHPDAGRRFELILAAYAATMGAKYWPKIEARLADGELHAEYMLVDYLTKP